MTDQEKQFYFGDDEPEGYEVIEVLRPKSKHNSEAKTRDVHFHAMGEQFKLKMKPNKKLMAPQVINMCLSYHHTLASCLLPGYGSETNA